MNVTRDGDADPELGQHPDGVDLAGRLDDPGQHQRPERLVADPVEAERVVDRRQRPPTGSARPCPPPPRSPIGRPPAVRRDPAACCPAWRPFPGDLQQHRQLVVVVGRADVVDPQHAPAPLVHDLDRGRPRRGLHPPHERRPPGEATHPASRVSDHTRANPATNTQVSAIRVYKIARSLQLRSDRPRASTRRSARNHLGRTAALVTLGYSEVVISLHEVALPDRSAGLSQGPLRTPQKPHNSAKRRRSPQESHGRNDTLRYTCYAC